MFNKHVASCRGVCSYDLCESFSKVRVGRHANCTAQRNRPIEGRSEKTSLDE
jgi:hypothetical protein